jgi:ABC-type multidrug transport system fused ATPase/permease subunit
MRSRLMGWWNQLEEFSNLPTYQLIVGVTGIIFMVIWNFKAITSYGMVRQIEPDVRVKVKYLEEMKKYATGKVFFTDPALFDSKSLNHVHERYEKLFDLLNDDIIYINLHYPQFQTLLVQSAELTMIIAACIFFIHLSWWSSLFCFIASVICRLTINQNTFVILSSIVCVNWILSLALFFSILYRLFCLFSGKYRTKKDT